MKYTLTLVLLILLKSTSAYAEIYKHQDLHGKWYFSDKPASAINTPIHTLSTRQAAVKQTLPHLETKQANGKTNYIAHNPMLAPVQCFLFDKNTKKKISMKVLKALSSETLFRQQRSQLNREVSFYYVVGDPATQPSDLVVQPPFVDYKPKKIGQAFNGSFSHNRHGSKYAVDIGMPVGTKITAAKAGLVFQTRDNYVFAGVSSPFFLDKANLVKILHDDGSYGVYAHFLHGGVHVKQGDRVAVGQVIGLSGNTGYSTGPHLHFVIRYNANGKTRSLPFKFLQSGNKEITPEKGNWLLPYSPD